MKISRALALVGGVVLPVLETIRRWHQLSDLHLAPIWLDDWCIGLFLLYGVWRTRNRDRSGRAVLAAAWGFACGLGYASFFAQLMSLDQPDPSGASSVTVVIVKGVMVAVALAALVLALRRDDD